MKLNEITDITSSGNATPQAYEDTAKIKAVTFPLLQDKIDKINRKAQKLGVPPVTLTIVNKFMQTEKNEFGFDRNEEYYTVRVQGDAPQIPGYKFMATIQHKGEAGNIIRTVPGEEGNPEIQRFYAAKQDYCDHCKKHRQRIDTFIIKDQQGHLRQIGRNCLADFLGGRDPKQLLFWFSIRDSVESAIGEVEQEESEGRRGYGSRSEYSVDPISVLTVAATLIRQFGYKKRLTQEEMYIQPRSSTSQDVRFVLFTKKPGRLTDEEQQLVDAAKTSTSADEDLAAAALAWFETIPNEEKARNEFFHNIDVILRSGKVTSRDVGYLVALLPTYHRAHHQQVERQRKSNEWLGEVGKKIPPTRVKVISSQMLTTDFGVTQLVRFEDELGNNLTWFNSGKTHLESDREYTIVGTVKKLDEFKGRKQTVLTRVKTL